jgi:hypothetical protein
MNLVPEYARPGTLPPKWALYRIAITCALLPLVCGVGTLVLYVFTRWPELRRVGLWIIVGGCVLVSVSGVCLFAFSWDAKRNNSLDEKARRSLLGLVQATIALNFAAASGCVFIGAVLPEARDAVPVGVLNQGTTQVERFALILQDGSHVQLGPIAVRGYAQCRFDAYQDGTISYSMTMNGKTSSDVVWHSLDELSNEARLMIFIEDDRVWAYYPGPH